MFDKLIEKVKAQPKTIVFTEGTDARIQEAAARLLAEDLMGVVLVGHVCNAIIVEFFKIFRWKIKKYALPLCITNVLWCRVLIAEKARFPQED